MKTVRFSKSVIRIPKESSEAFKAVRKEKDIKVKCYEEVIQPVRFSEVFYQRSGVEL